METLTEQKAFRYSLIAGTVLISAYMLGRVVDRTVATAKPEAIYLIDINGDGRKDIVIKFQAGNYSALLQDERGNFIRDASLSIKDITSKLEQE